MGSLDFKGRVLTKFTIFRVEKTIFSIFMGVERNSEIFRGGQIFFFTFRGGPDEIDLKCP